MTPSLRFHSPFRFLQFLCVSAGAIALMTHPGRSFAQPSEGSPVESSTSTVTLQSSIDYALAHRFNLAAAQSAIAAAQSGVTLSRAQYRPSLSLGVSAVDIIQRQQSVLIEDVLITEEESSDNFYSAGLTLSIPLFIEGGLVFRTLPSEKIALAGLKTQQETHQQTREEVIYNVSAAFFGALKADRDVLVQEEAVKSAEAQYLLSKERYDRELITKNDLLVTQIALTTSRKDLTLALNNQAAARFNLAMQMGLDPMETVRAEASAPLLPELPPIQELIQKAHRLRQDIALQQAAVESARGSLELSKSNRFPVLNLSSSYRIVDDYQAPVLAKSWMAVLSISVPIWDFGLKGADISQKSYSLRAAEETLQEVKSSAAQEIQGLYTAIKNQEAAIPLLDQLLEQADEALKTAEEKYRQNLVPESSVLAARQAKIAAQTARITAEYDRQINFASLRKAVGGEGAF
ncbi:MAG: TolC family protein [Nitrospirae bacterium]|nr:TolC family protein [Nitrospirota bacterium]